MIKDSSEILRGCNFCFGVGRHEKGCPNEVLNYCEYCSSCGEPIEYGEMIYENKLDDCKIYCPECIENMDTDELIELLLNKGVC